MTAHLEADLRPLIHEIRGVQVMLDRDLALLYGVPTKRLNEQVRRNIERFPEDFMFQLTAEECSRSQFATGSDRLTLTRRFFRYLPKRSATCVWQSARRAPH